MDVGFGISITPEIGDKLDRWGLMKFTIPCSEDYKAIEIVIGLVCVWEEAKMFNGIEPTYSRKNKRFAFGVYLDHDFIKNTSSDLIIKEYVIQKISDRFQEILKYKGLQAMPNREMLDAILDGLNVEWQC